MRVPARFLSVVVAVLVGGTSLGIVADDTPFAPPAAADAGEARVGVPRARAAVITAGAAHSCAITGNGGAAGGDVRCWGDNAYGQLGLGDTNDRGDAPGELSGAAPVALAGSALSIAAGDHHTCALLVGGSVKCWGRNQSGQLGLGDTNNRGDGAGEMGASLPAVPLGAGRTATMIAAGGAFTCALLDNGALKCWGANGSGQLGLGDTSARGDQAGEVAALTGINFGLPASTVLTAVAAGGEHVCALFSDNTLRCWGENSSGQLGLGNTNDRGDQAGEMGSIEVGLPVPPALMALGRAHTCAATAIQVMCWGANNAGQLGNRAVGSNAGDGAGEMGRRCPR